MLGLDGIQRASSSGIGSKASARSRRLTTIGLSRRFLAGSNAAADNYRIGNARSSFHVGLSRTRVQLPPPPPSSLNSISRAVRWILLPGTRPLHPALLDRRCGLFRSEERDQPFGRFRFLRA